MLFVCNLFDNYRAEIMNSETMGTRIMTRKDILLLSKVYDIVGVSVKQGEIVELQEFSYQIVGYDNIGHVDEAITFVQNGKTWILRRKRSELNAMYSSERTKFFVRTADDNITYLAEPKEGVGKYTSVKDFAKEFKTFDEAKGTAVTMTKRGNRNVAWRVE